METDGRPVSTLHDYLRVLRRRKWLVIIPVLLAPLVAVLLALGKPTLYTASAHVLVSRQGVSSSLLGLNDPTQLDSVRLLTTQAQFARLPAIAQAALNDAGVRDESASDLLGASSVTSSDNSDFLTFTVSDAHPALAMRLAAAYANEYVVYHRQYDTAQFAAAAQAIQARIQDLQRAGGARSALYRGLLTQASQLTTLEAVASKTAGLVSVGGGASASPVAQDAILALVVALVTGVALAFLRDALDPRVRSAEETAGKLQLRLLARLPRPPRALRKANRLVMLAAPQSPYAEPYRMLRTSLEFVIGREPDDGRLVPLANRWSDSPLSPAQRHYRMMITSAVEGEGKSTTVANLGVAFARAGRRVLLVDLDFRRPSLNRFFGLDVNPGLADAVLGSTPVSAIQSEISLPAGARGEPINRLPVGSLRVVPLGTLPPHAVDASVFGRLEHVLSELEKDADLVLIDSPPLLRVGDALALTSYVDGLLVVASLRTVRAPMLKDLRRLLDDTPVTKLGFILTGADLEGGYEYLADRGHHGAVEVG